jgi:hypothetical protein
VGNHKTQPAGHATTEPGANLPTCHVAKRRQLAKKWKNIMSTTESAVERCAKAYYDKAEIEDPHDTGVDPAALERVHLAYRHAMPYLLPDPDSIDAFIACVTHGLVIQVFEPAEASKLLYAAQVALGSLRARNQASPQQSKSEPKSELAAPFPRPPTPLPSGTNTAEAKRPAPQAPPTKPMQPAQNEIDILLEQLYNGQLPGEKPLANLAPKPVQPQRPPTPSLASATQQTLRAAS